MTAKKNRITVVKNKITIKTSQAKKRIKLRENDEIYIDEKHKSLLKGIKFPNELFAITHKDRIEFIYQKMIANNDPLKEREFNFFYSGKNFKCYFGPTSKQLESIIKSLDFPLSETRDIIDYWLYYNKKDINSILLKNRNPYSFFIKGDFKEINIIELCKSLNFYMSFYDRKSPRIVFIESNKNEKKYEIPCLSKKDGEFSKTISGNKIEPVLCEIYEAALDTSSIRLKYIFFFQILEYISYYFLDNDIKKNIQNILNNPDICYNSDKYARTIIEKFKDNFKENDDPTKIKKTIKNYITLEDIINEIETNRDYFSQKIIFDGGFEIDKILNDNTIITEEPTKDMIFDAILKNITSIRNVLIHARDSKENKVILPTLKNEKKLLPYLYILRRISEYTMIRNKN